jgi:hypothetical protein
MALTTLQPLLGKPTEIRFVDDAVLQPRQRILANWPQEEIIQKPFGIVTMHGASTVSSIINGFFLHNGPFFPTGPSTIGLKTELVFGQANNTATTAESRKTLHGFWRLTIGCVRFSSFCRAQGAQSFVYPIAHTTGPTHGYPTRCRPSRAGTNHSKHESTSYLYRKSEES